MVGGKNYRKSQFNLAVQGERQPGSSFKPFVLATALKQGISPATHVRVEAGDDPARRQASGTCTTTRAPTSGSIDLTTATDVLRQHRLRAADAARRAGRRSRGRRSSLGITSPLKNYFAIGLGGEAVNPLEMARAYSAFANGGKRIDGSVVRQPSARDRRSCRTRTADRRRQPAGRGDRC